MLYSLLTSCQLLMPGFIAALDLFQIGWKPPALLSADHVVSSETVSLVGPPYRTMWWNRDLVQFVMGKFRLGIKTHRRVGTTVTGNGGPNNRSGSSPPSQSSVPGGTVYSHRRFLLIGNVMIASPCRTRSSFGTYSRHPGPQKVDWLARTSQTSA